ncbi:non-ribosomal peptide synthetase [Vibrio mangrovi]|uniref:Non-ribosomal peptide synthetase n=1 Tax=Vibrio mangrovi TaxID=474394 RepID=A0ABU4I4P3_9VIBR|nr:non-ribosomal peptide synthetase [Vibrio mangrovi]MDW6002522.1 non-ribosomal peptide synthetase [Vibrio mangrovi]
MALPLSSAQRGIWFAQELNPDAHGKIFKITEYLEITGVVQPDIFEIAIRRTAKEIETFQQVFELTAQGPKQRFGVAPDWELPILDFQTEVDPQFAAKAWINHDLARPFDLRQGPPFSFALLQLGPERFWYYACVHHLVLDGFGGVLLSSRVAEIYSALVAGEEPPACNFISLSDALEIEREYQTSKNYQRDREYWMDVLQDRPAPVSLADTKATCTDIIRQQMYLPASTNRMLRNLAVECKSQVPQLLIALIAIYLNRVTGEEDLVVGCPMVARTNRTLRSFPGMVSNVLPLRLQIGSEDTLTDIVAQVKRRILGAVRHQCYRGEDLAADLGMITESDLLFSTHINILPFEYEMKFGDAPVNVNNLTLGPIDDLSINICDRGPQQGLELCLDANAALYSEMTLASHFHRLMYFFTAAASESPLTAINRYHLLMPEERTLVDSWNRTQITFPAARCVHELFEQQASDEPEHTALVCAGETVNYGGLNIRANRLAHYLRSIGVGPETRVGICCGRGPDLLIAMLATLKAGGGYVPMDPGYPAERLQYMLSDSAPAVVLTDGVVDLDSLVGDVLTAGPRVIHLQQDRGLWFEQPSSNPDPGDLSPDNLAYIIYTSGSTGVPKGVMVEHRQLLNLVNWHNRAFNMQPGTYASSVAGLGFDAVVWEIWPPLSAGATLTMPTLEMSRDPEQLLNWWVEQPIEVGFLPTPIAELAFARRIAPETLRYLLVGGDRLTRHPDEDATFTLVNNYGPTETAVVATSATVRKTDAVLHIGSPIANTSIYILDELQRQVPVGVTGEIYIGGHGVARGYLNRAEMTTERFLADPFSERAGARMYRTGDLARWRVDGTIEYQGRNDSQVKIRGFRIELGEIATALQACPGIQNAVVTVSGAGENAERLVAYYTCQKNESVAIELLKQRLSEALPSYMVPAAFVGLDAIPLTANGKIDHKALPEPDASAFVHRDYEPPRGGVEQLLAVIWQSLLKVDRVGRHDNFFELGGHSLLAVQLIERLRHHRYHLAIKSLFTAPTLAGLARTLEQASAKPELLVPQNLIPAECTQITPDMLSLVELSQSQIDTIAATVPGGAANIQDVYPLAPLQEGILFHHLLEEKGDPYITRAIKAFSTQHELLQFVDALQAVVKRHDILRTSIVWDQLDVPVQVVWRDAVLPLTQLTLKGDDIVKAIQQRFDPASTRLDVHKAPMIETYQVEDAAEDRWLLCLLMHHFCLDHTTLELMMEEVQAHLLNQADQLPKPLPFRNFVFESRIDNDPEKQAAYFRERLGDIDEPSAPFGLLNVQGDGHEIHELHLPVDDDLAQQLREQARRQGVSAASLFHLAWGLVVRATTGRDDVVFGTVLFGRMAGGEGADRVLGMFLNTLPLRLSFSDEAVAEAVQYTHKHLADILEYEHGSLSLAQQCSAVAPQTPLFSSLLNYRYDGGNSQMGLDTGPMNLLFTEERTNYPITLSVNDNPQQGFSLDIQVDGSIGCERIGAMVMRALRELATALESEPKRAIHSLNVLPKDEYRRLVEQFNTTQTSAVTEVCVHTLFEKQADKYPDVMAAVSESQQLTYGELNRKANSLAYYLRAQGVAPDQRVGLCFDRGTDLMVAMLATLKAGGCYIPMDPTYPADRLQYMVSDSQPTLILSDGILEPETIIGKTEVQVINVCTDAFLWSAYPKHNPQSGHIRPDHLAYIIYTSGSTGQPKGVMVEHRNLANLVHWHNQSFGIQPGTCVSSVAGVGFDATVWEVWPPLCTGAHLMLPTLDISRDPEQLLAWWMSQPIEVGFLSTPIAELVLARRLDHPTLRTLLVGGDRLNHHPHPETSFTLVNNYGPTETTVVATSGTMLPTDAVLHIGKPVDNTSIYILDEYRQPVPMGVKGEIYIGGKSVTRGYLNLPEMTAERFLDDPFSSEAGARMYRSGDLGRWSENGTVEYLGRNDSQVKIRGFRIELGEISTCMSTHHGVDEAIVIAAKTQNNDQRLVAYYVGNAQTAPLRAYLAARLPDYMVPAAYVKLEHIPLTPNGKVDHKALPEPDAADFVTQVYIPPEGEVEETIAAIWQRLLGVEKVGRNDSFFELGGHSLVAVQFLNEARQHGYELTLSTLFSASRLADIADYIQRSSATLIEHAVALRPVTGDQRPLFIVPEASGEMLYSPLLTSYIDKDIAVYGLVAPDRSTPPFYTVQGAAARYVRIIRETQPEGPYRMTGISLGGTLAYEVALQLLGQDQEIEYIGVIDTTAEKAIVPRHVGEEVLTEEQKILLMSKEIYDGLAYDIYGLAEAESTLEDGMTWKDHYRMAKDMGMLPAGWTDTYFMNWMLHREALIRAEYEYRNLPVDIDLYVAELRPEGEAADVVPYLRWNGFLPETSIRPTTIQGTTHYHLIVEPYIGYLGQAISKDLHDREQNYAAGKVMRNAEYDPIVTLQEGYGNGPTVLCIPGAGDNVCAFLGLVQSLEANWTVLGFQPRGLKGGDIPHTTVEAAASFYLKALEARACVGPIHIVGHSFGGWVALELAALLEAEGIKVASLTVADSEAPDATPQEYSDLSALMLLIEQFEKQGAALGLTEQDLKGMEQRERLTLVHRYLVEQGILTKNASVDDLDGIFHVFVTNLRTPYQPAVLPEVQVNLVMTQDMESGVREAWQEQLSNLHCIPSRADHFSLLRAPFVKVITEVLNPSFKALVTDI